MLKLAKGKRVKVGQKLTFTVRVVRTDNKAESVKLTIRAKK